MSEQSQLFDTAPPPWELDAQEERLIASIVFPEGPEGVFSYAVPAALAGVVEAGRRVMVPLGAGNRPIVGYCVEAGHQKSARKTLKEVRSVVDQTRLLSPALLRMTKWMADYYLCPWGNVLEAVIPSGVRFQAGTREAVLLSVPTQVAARITQLKLPPKQQEVLLRLAASPDPMTKGELAAAVRCTTGPIDSLIKKGYIDVEKKRISQTEVHEAPAVREAHHELNADQQAALKAVLDALQAQEARTILIHGVTGSGKTEIYIRAIEEVISYGRAALVLVPEISLTPQARQRFRARFERVAVLHSMLTPAERHWHWQEIARGNVQVVVGARSAVFAPIPHLGLIILDEEHDSSFKQDTAPRYHARDVALFRAREESVPLVLGSATPSLESWQRAKEGKSQLVSMPRRVYDRPLPEVGVIDLREDFRSPFSRGAISRPLAKAIEDALADNGQVILLLNRRGFATHIQCPSCGHVVKCVSCDIALTHHRTIEKAVCHYCDYTIEVPTQCPQCHSLQIRYSGIGTERLEAEVRSRFEGVPCLRMDSDSMQKPGSHEQALAKFRDGEIKILLGTQMIAKGLDFPNVTLVGVVNSDTALHLPDFRAAERTFQLVTQVAGRTGRGDRGGRVLVQTFSPDHPAIQAAVRHDYESFAKFELPNREAFGYPPCGSMIRIIVRGIVEAQTEQFAELIGQRINEQLLDAADTCRVLGPGPAPIAKIKDRYRYHLLLAGPDGERLRKAVSLATADIKAPEDVQWVVDVDPVDML